MFLVFLNLSSAFGIIVYSSSSSSKHLQYLVEQYWCFWTVVLEKTLERPLDCEEFQPVHPKGDQSWVFIGRTGVKLKLQYFGHLMRRADSLEKTLMLGKIEGRRRGQQRMRCWMASLTQWTWVWVNSKSWWLTGRPGVLQFMGSQRVGHDRVTEMTDSCFSCFTAHFSLL